MESRSAPRSSSGDDLSNDGGGSDHRSDHLAYHCRVSAICDSSQSVERTYSPSHADLVLSERHIPDVLVATAERARRSDWRLVALDSDTKWASSIRRIQVENSDNRDPRARYSPLQVLSFFPDLI